MREFFMRLDELVDYIENALVKYFDDHKTLTEIVDFNFGILKFDNNFFSVYWFLMLAIVVVLFVFYLLNLSLFLVFACVLTINAFLMFLYWVFGGTLLEGLFLLLHCFSSLIVLLPIATVVRFIFWKYIPVYINLNFLNFIDDLSYRHFLSKTRHQCVCLHRNELMMMKLSGFNELQ